MNNRNYLFEIIGLVIVVILGFIEYTTPSSEISFWLLLSILIFVVIFTIYVFVKNKIGLLDELSRKVNSFEEKLNFKNNISELDKRLALLEKYAKK